MNNQWKGTNRHKYLLQFHLIFVCKYRKHLLARKDLSDRTKELSRELCEKHKVTIRYMETDNDHIHYMIGTGLEKLHDLSYLERLSGCAAKTLLEGVHLLDRRLLCLFCRKCIRADAKGVYREPGLNRPGWLS